VIIGYQPIYRKTMHETFVIAGCLYLQWWTHKLGGWHKNVFITVAKKDEVYP
jgi:hypothetical protein